MVNLFNTLSPQRFRHTVVALTDYSDFRHRITAQPVDFHALHRAPGHGLGWAGRLWKLLRQLKPDLVHTRNLAALEAQFVAAAAGIRTTVHGEHGRDVFDLHGKNWKYNLLRRAARPLVSNYIAVSRDLESLAAHDHRRAVAQAAPDLQRRRQRKIPSSHRGAASVRPSREHCFRLGGAHGRGQGLPHADACLHPDGAPAARTGRACAPGHRRRRPGAFDLSRTAAGCWACPTWPGCRASATILQTSCRCSTCSCCRPRNEGISNTILEALASGLPVIATAVGGNVELVEAGVNGTLVQAGRRGRDGTGLAQLSGRACPHCRTGRQRAAAGRAALQHSGHGRGVCQGIRSNLGAQTLSRRQAV